MHFVSLLFLNERNITTSLLMIQIKCAVVYYSNLNPSSINKPSLNYGPLNMLFLFFFDFLFVFILTRLLSKNYEITIILNVNFQNSFQDAVYYKILGCQTLWYQNGGTLWPFFRSKIVIFEISFKRLHEESFEDLEFISNWKLETRTALSHKMTPLKSFTQKLHRNPLLIASIVKGIASRLRQFLPTESPWNIMKNPFYFS